MQAIAVFAALLAVANAAGIHLATVPQTGAVVTSQRLGGNFAYSVNQGGYAGYPYTQGYQPVVYTAGSVPTVGTQYVNKVPVTYGAYPNVYNGVYGGYNTVPVQTVVGTPAATTYKTVAGVSPIAYNGLVGNNYYNGYGAYPYGAGYQQVVY